MGRIKTQKTKRVTRQVMREHGAEVTPDFSANKILLGKILEVKSKKLRNVIAGYMSRLAKTKDSI